MRRVIAVVAALLLAGLGTVLLVRFVQTAEHHATEGLTMVSVLVVDTPSRPAPGPRTWAAW